MLRFAAWCSFFANFLNKSRGRSSKGPRFASRRAALCRLVLSTGDSGWCRGAVLSLLRGKVKTAVMSEVFFRDVRVRVRFRFFAGVFFRAPLGRWVCLEEPRGVEFRRKEIPCRIEARFTV